MLFHLLVPGGKWQTVTSSPVSLARLASFVFQSQSWYPLLPPPRVRPWGTRCVRLGHDRRSDPCYRRRFCQRTSVLGHERIFEYRWAATTPDPKAREETASCRASSTPARVASTSSSPSQPRCPIRKTLPLSLPRPTPRARFRRSWATWTTRSESASPSSATAVRLLEARSGS